MGKKPLFYQILHLLCFRIKGIDCIQKGKTVKSLCVIKNFLVLLSFTSIMSSRTFTSKTYSYRIKGFLYEVESPLSVSIRKTQKSRPNVCL